MAQMRPRFLAARIQKLQSLWPVVGVVGPRQCGKSTLFRDQMNIEHQITLDDDDVRDDAVASAKAFLGRLPRPVLIDEIQKVPKLFDAIKSDVDKKRIPGRFFLTGSSQFSARAGIRESLTGRIGIAQLYPLTIAEAKQESAPIFEQSLSLKSTKLRFDTADVAHHMSRGGMPVPMFLRDEGIRHEYWQGWLETTIYRDLARLFKRSFDPEFAMRIIKKFADCFRNGELPTIQNLLGGRQKLHTYLEGLETIFVIKRIPIHPNGTGRDAYMFFDSGFLFNLMGQRHGDGTSLSLARHFIWQETSSYLSCHGIRDERTYYKSTRGAPVDMIWNDIAIKVVAASTITEWDERNIASAMKTLNLTRGLIVAPIDQIYIPKKEGIGRVPWGYWS